MDDFAEFFRTATGFRPHGYQVRLARDGLPDVVAAPTGTGKTGIVLAWLWRRLYGEPDRTPRRLIFALPMRSLVDQTAGEVSKWLTALGLSDDVALHVVMGGRGESQWDWRQDMHMPAIVVGTVDSLVSKALNRGYGVGRATYPLDFALVTNGAHWVLDEVQLCRESVTTLRQIASFAEKYGTAEPFGLTCMSATVPDRLLETVDNPLVGSVVEVLLEERAGELAVRLGARRTIRRVDSTPGDEKAIASAALNHHRAGELTLVVLNTVKTAKSVYERVRRQHEKVTLLHSRFRAVDRARLMDAVLNDRADRIVVSTQVVEAGIDLNAATMLTEAAPWPSIVQRAGRCNRTGLITSAELFWAEPKGPEPYEATDIGASIAALKDLEGIAVTSEGLRDRRPVVTEQEVTVLRRPDFLALFDTSPDLSGNDIDVAPYVRDADDLDAQVAWATWTEDDQNEPPGDAKAPAAEFRCRVPLREVNAFAKNVAVWRLDQVLGRWTRVTGQARVRPGEVVLVNARNGGYDSEIGFDPGIKTPVSGAAVLRTKAERAADTEDAFGADSTNVQQKQWLALNQHSEDVQAQTHRLLEATRPALPAGAAESAVLAGYLHDTGKAHPTWQDALCALKADISREEIEAGRPWAKSKAEGQLRFKDGVAFRHELASLLLIEEPLRHLLDRAPDPDLARYLVLAHHGKLRMQVRDPGDLAVLPSGEAGEHTILGLRHGETVDIPPMLGQPATELTIDLDQFTFGGERSWTRTTADLLERYGPFMLAYLEATVRVADWRASAGQEVAS